MSGIPSHLTIAFPLKSPGDAKAVPEELSPLMPALFQAEDSLGTVHYSRFVVLPDNTLCFIADLDGEPDEFVNGLAKSAGSVFDTIFKHVENPPVTPVASNAQAFLKWVNDHKVQPLTTYSACENTVAEIKSFASTAGFKGSSEYHPLLNYLVIKSKLKTFVLEEVVLRATKGKMKTGADSIGTLHFAHFVPLPNNHLGFFTIFDGSFEKYIQDFTDKIGPVFDTLFEFTLDPPPTPVEKNAKAFYQWAVSVNLPPIGLYSAYPGVAVQDIKALLADAKQGVS
jgi:hypothetical protein